MGTIAEEDVLVVMLAADAEEELADVDEAVVEVGAPDVDTAEPFVM